MPVDHIRYDILAREALRGVVRTVLADTAKNGLLGDHHFYISFATRADGVRLSARMLAEYPEEMTIVLQHQFWDLVVTEEGFEVGMSFGGIPERVAVPFAAITGFLDPSVEFGLRFQEVGDDAGEDPEKAQEKSQESQPDGSAAAGKRPPAARTAPTLAAVPAPVASEPTGAAPADKPTPDEGPDKPAGSGEVVRLDRFRKK
jgi:hypothetical protein